MLSREWPRHRLVSSRTRLSRQRYAAATADGCCASGREASSGHVYRLLHCLPHHQSPLPGRNIDSCQSSAQDPPHSDGHLRRGNRDGASALTEARSGDTLCSEPFSVRRDVIRGDIFSPLCLTLGLDRIFRLHAIAGLGIGGPSLCAVTASKLE